MKKWNEGPIFVLARGKKSEDLVSELKKIVAVRYVLPEKTVTNKDCVFVLLDIVYDIIKISDNPKHMFMELFLDVAPNRTFAIGYDAKSKDDVYDLNTAIIYKCVSIIRYANIDVLEKVLNKEEDK